MFKKIFNKGGKGPESLGEVVKQAGEFVEEAQEKQEKVEEPIDLFQTGDEVAVKRSSGAIETGWKFVKYIKDTGRVIVVKESEEPGGLRSVKRVLVSDFLEWNK